jgi:hypothetical protein
MPNADRVSRCPTTLPLKDSNLRSPDPESDASPRLAGTAAGNRVENAQIRAEAHTISPTREPSPEPYPVLVRGSEWNVSAIIYGLVDPRKPAVVRYVGKTAQTPGMRYNGHLLERSKAGWKRGWWIFKLKEAGLRPDMVLLETVAQNDRVEAREHHWITTLRQQGMADLNVSIPTLYTEREIEMLKLRPREVEKRRRGHR